MVCDGEPTYAVPERVRDSRGENFKYTLWPAVSVHCSGSHGN